MQLSQLLNDLVNINNDIDNLSEKLKNKREKKNQLSNAILKYMKQNNINKLNDKNNNSFISKSTKTYSTISQKLLRDTFETKFNKSESDKLLKLILDSREEKEDFNLVIKSNNK